MSATKLRIFGHILPYLILSALLSSQPQNSCDCHVVITKRRKIKLAIAAI
jgi:hypothetical protein